MSQVLARKWRPQTFSELVGQEHVVRALSNALKQQRLHHAYLFTGTRGIGKTTLARIVAKALNCETGVTDQPCGKCSACVEISAGRFVDLIEIDAASNTQVDSMRELLDSALYAPTVGRFKVYIIDEVHMLSRSAFNAMLKTLEEPPEHVKFILATTDPQKVPVTVLSRCLQFNLKQIPPPQIQTQLKKILELEGIAFEEGALALLARAARGSLRDSLSLLDQAIPHGGGRVELTAVRAMLGGVEQEYLYEILDGLQRSDGAALIAVADRMAERSLSFEMALQDLASLLQRVALARSAAMPADDDPDRAVIEKFASVFDPEDVQLYYQIALQGRQDIGLAPDEYAGFTMTLLRMLAFAPENAGAGVDAGAPAGAEKAPAAGSKKKPADTDWNTLIAGLPLSGMERMLARNSELVAWSDGRIQLRVPPAQRHLAERAYQERLKSALEQHLGTGIRLEVAVGNGSGNTVAEVHERENQQRRDAASAAIDSDPFVRELVRDFDARVVASSVKPNDNGERGS
ncbi:MAG TPA: DNA polymerase III subunit gamma/tau [Burkholderiales bacterium]|nr:DNA polymerase III subunit gamma/tau [Burkholderiales bacterium]